MPEKESRSDFKARIGRMKVEELMKQFPQSKVVLYEHFGASCMDCPAAFEEDLELAIRVHDSLEEDFYDDLAGVFGVELV